MIWLMDDSAVVGRGSRRVGRGGRQRDDTRDADILDATLEVLAEVGYERMTMNAVAARAHAGKATVYRRWESKPQLVLDAFRHMGRTAKIEQPPDTGSLREDLRAMFKPGAIEEKQRKLSVTKGLLSMASQDLEVAEITNAVCIEPWASAFREMIDRAIARGEMADDVDLNMLSRLIPSLAAYRALVEGKSVDRPFLLDMVDKLLLPAAGVAPPVSD
ncbi:DNA-binding transcriptional regulator, AcrR family [Streptomyces sp. 3213]|nr:DNA-binding transcriptional regulator, AcrR family [Streptomyces sp. 3213] [Streptomyces sp. 3213.3]